MGVASGLTCNDPGRNCEEVAELAFEGNIGCEFGGDSQEEMGKSMILKSVAVTPMNTILSGCFCGVVSVAERR